MPWFVNYGLDFFSTLVETECAKRHIFGVGQKAFDVVEGIDHKYLLVDRRIEHFDEKVAAVIEVHLTVSYGARHDVIRLCGNNITLLFKRRTFEIIDAEYTFLFHNGYP